MLVSTVVMATLVVGPFYLARTLNLNEAMVGLIMSIGPLVAALAGVPAGHLTERLGAQRVATLGLTAMVTGSFLLCATPARTFSYLMSIATMTAGYALFQTANNTETLANLRADQRGVVSGLLNLSRNLGLITGASVMGAVFGHASGSVDIITASAGSVRHGMQITFLLAFILIMFALGIQSSGMRSWQRRSLRLAEHL